MKRFPFYAYPNLPHSFYASPAENSYHRPHHPSSPAPPSAPSRRSVVNVPVFDSAPSQSTSSPPQPHRPSTVPPTDPHSAAIRIQSHFRGFYVQKHRPLVHLRSIAKARKQLEELQTELEGPGFALKVRTSEKERLRFSESVMAILLRLDAVEGSMAEVRSQRKEATKMAVKLQDTLDAILMQKDEIVALDPTADDGGIAPKDNYVLFEQSQEPLCSEVHMVQGDAYTISERDSMDVNQVRENPPSFEDDSADKCMPNFDNNDVMDMVPENASPSKNVVKFCVMEGSGQLTEMGFEAVSQGQPVKAMHDEEQDVSYVTGDHADSDAAQAAEEEVNDGIHTLHLEAHENHTQNDEFVDKVDQDTNVNDIILERHGAMQRESTDGSYTCMDVAQKDQDGLSQNVELCPGTPMAQETGDHLHCSNDPYKLQGPQTVLERLTESNCSSDRNGSSMLHRHECEERSNKPPENNSNEAKICENVKAQSSIVSVAETLCLQDSAVLHQLSEDCKCLKSLVGKLLVQNRAQSNVLCALSERLETLEHQQQLHCHQNLQKARKKRKLKKGSKRSVKCRNCESYDGLF